MFVMILSKHTGTFGTTDHAYNKRYKLICVSLAAERELGNSMRKHALIYSLNLSQYTWTCVEQFAQYTIVIQ